MDKEEREAVGRTNYCRMFGHDYHVQALEGDMVLLCRNHCQADGVFKLVRRDA